VLLAIEFRVDTADLSTDVQKPIPCSPGPPELVAGFLAIARDDRWHIDHRATHASDFAVRLQQLHELLAEGDFEFGHRVFYEAVRYAAMLDAAGDSELTHALDDQIMQKILPRLHGSRRRLEPTLCAVGQFCFDPSVPPRAETTVGPLQFDPMRPPAGEPRLPRSFSKVQRMTRNLRANQFASFAE